MLEIASSDLQSFPFDHHGLIASICKDLQIAERIDSLLPVHEDRVVSPGRAAVALILNGLGFTNRRLYLTPQFFASKPVERLLCKVRAFQREVDLEGDFKWVADSALYSADRLLSKNDYLWLTRVPETVAEAREWVSRPDGDIPWQAAEDGYKYAETLSVYGNVPQRWLLVYSEQGYAREKKTLEKNLAKQEEQLKKEMRQLGSVAFGCVHDAEVEIAKLQKEYPLYLVHGQAVAVKKSASKGKPASDAVPLRVEYKLDLMVERNEAAVGELLNRKGRFILATNDMDAEAYPAARMLSEYKEQQNVEGGFRFLKDPWFMVDSVFLKSPQRIAALMAVMTLCLLVYNIAQYKLRSRLKEAGGTLPNQLNKQVQNPTMRWIFQIMEGLGIVRIQENPDGPPRELLTNMSALRKKIIQLFGPTACRMHGLNPESAL